MPNFSESEKDVAAVESLSHEAMMDKSIWEAIDEIMRGVPEAALNRLPADGTERHDHYLRNAHEKALRES